MTPVNWKGRQKKDRNVSTLGAKISSPKTEMEPEKGPLGERRAKKKIGFQPLVFWGVRSVRYTKGVLAYLLSTWVCVFFLSRVS